MDKQEWDIGLLPFFQGSIHATEPPSLWLALLLLASLLLLLASLYLSLLAVQCAISKRRARRCFGQHPAHGPVVRAWDDKQEMLIQIFSG